MPETVEQLADKLAAEGEKTHAFFAELPAAAWDLELYADGEHWRVRQVLVHLVQAEDSIARLIQTILDGHPGVPENFNLDAYNHRKVHEMEAMPVDYLLPLFTERRAKTVSMVRRMDPLDLERLGRHPFLGVAPVVDMLKLLYRHTQLHQRDIRKLLKSETGENG